MSLGDEPVPLDVGDRGRPAAKGEIGSLIHHWIATGRAGSGRCRSVGRASAPVRGRAVCSRKLLHRAPQGLPAAAMQLLRIASAPLGGHQRRRWYSARRKRRSRTKSRAASAWCANGPSRETGPRRRTHPGSTPGSSAGGVSPAAASVLHGRKSRRTPRSCSATALPGAAARDAPTALPSARTACAARCTFLKLWRISFGAATAATGLSARTRTGAGLASAARKRRTRRRVEGRSSMLSMRDRALRALAREPLAQRRELAGIAVMQLVDEGGEARELHVQVADGAERADQGLPCRALSDERLRQIRLENSAVSFRSDVPRRAARATPPDPRPAWRRARAQASSQDAVAGLPVRPRRR